MCQCQKAASDNLVMAVGMEKDVAFEHVPDEVFLKAGRALGMGGKRPHVGEELVKSTWWGSAGSQRAETPDNFGSPDAKSCFFISAQ